MECSICFNAITAATGKVELSCSHPFHFSCLTKWFDKQNMEGCEQNCPLCRHEANEFEKMPAPVDEDDEDDEDEDDEDDEPTLDELAAQERARHRFARYKLINPIEEVQLYAANLIKACWRGYQDRLNFNELLAQKENIKFYQEHLKLALLGEKFLKKNLGLNRIQVKARATTAIQSAWRGHKVRMQIKEKMEADLRGLRRYVSLRGIRSITRRHSCTF